MNALQIIIIGAQLLVLIGQFAYLIWSVRKDHDRRKKQSTIEYVNAIRDKFKPLDDDIRKEFGKNVVNADKIDEDTRRNISQLLSTVEHLSVGVNTGVYDLHTLTRMSGSFFINMHYRYGPFIREAREGQRSAYVEFTYLIRRIQKIKEEETYTKYLARKANVLS